MNAPFSFANETLTPEDIATLRQLAHTLWDGRHVIAARWSERLVAVLPEYFTGRGGLSVDGLTELNERFLSLVLQHLQNGDMPALFQAYYATNRELIEMDLQRAPSRRISLNGLYTSASVSLRVIGEYVAPDDQRLMLAYLRLTTHLVMLVGEAYSDAREEYLQRMFEQINTLSHELRTPLSHLFSYLEMLRAGDFGAVSAEQERVLGELMHGADDLLLLLTGTLDLSRLDTGRVEVRSEEFPLAAVFADVVNSTPHPNVAVNWNVSADLPVLRTDRIKVKQIIGNLLRNAVRYGAGSPVFMTAASPQAGLVEVSVLDHGPGIAPADLNVIFDFFERGNTAGLARDGYGIGLHVVRRLVRLLGGAIAVDSVLGEGTCFRFTIRLSAPEPTAPAAA